MNVLTTTWRQLVRRRLWPVAVLLIGALAAVPFVLAKDPAPVVPEAPVTTAPADSAKADDSLAEPVVAKVSSADRSRRRRVLGVRKDPFAPAPVKKPKKKKTAKKAAKTPATDTGGGGTSAPAPTSPVPSTPVVTTPVKKKKVYAKDSLIVRFGDATTTLAKLNLKKLAPLPDDEAPLLVYMGLTDHGTKAIFLVDESLDAQGDGTCKPHPASCETIELAKGETEFFDYVDPETGKVTAQYELDLLDIK
jgi:hypothetical protein